MLKTIKPYWRIVLSKIGVVDKNAAKLGLNQLRETDVFVVSFPKSGNTWLRFILANMLEGEKEITLKNINEYVPGIYNFREQIDSTEGKRFVKSHDPLFQSYPKTLYIYRDYRDVLVSYFHYLKSHGEFDGTVQDFAKSEHLNTSFGLWEHHVMKALRHKEHFPDQIMMIGFDELKSQPERTITDVAEFCDLKPKRSVSEIVERCSFENLRSVEEKYGKVFAKSKVDFFRSGESDQWLKYFSAEEMDSILTEDIKNALKALHLKV